MRFILRPLDMREFLGKTKARNAAYIDICEYRRRVLTTKLSKKRGLILVILTLFINYCCYAQQQDSDTTVKEKSVSNTSIKNENIVENKDIGKENKYNLFGVNSTDIVLGNPLSKVVMIEYSSFTCPACASYHSLIYPKIKELYIDTRKIAYVTRECINCKQDFDASILLRCVNNDKKETVIKSLFTEQEKWAFNNKYKDLLLNVAKMADLSEEHYNQCQNNADLVKIFKENNSFLAGIKEFTGIPCFIIDNKPFVGVRPVEYFINAIEQAISNAQ